MIYRTDSGRVCPDCRQPGALDDAALVALGKQLKTVCGTVKLVLMHEIDHNGLSDLLKPLRTG